MEGDVERVKYVTLLENFIQMIELYQNLNKEFQEFKEKTEENVFTQRPSENDTLALK